MQLRYQPRCSRNASRFDNRKVGGMYEVRPSVQPYRDGAPIEFGIRGHAFIDDFIGFKVVN